MKKYYFPLALAAALALCSCAKTTIDWHMNDIEAAYARAKTQGALVMVDVYTDWCGWCKTLDTNTFADTRVIESAKPFVALKINPERTEAEAAFALRYGVRAYPAVLFTDADGALVGRVTGYLEPEAFLKELRRAEETSARIDALDVTDPNAVVELAGVYLSLGRAADVVPFIETLERAYNDEQKAYLYLALSEGFLAEGNVRDARYFARQTLTPYAQTKPHWVDYQKDLLKRIDAYALAAEQ